MMESPERKAVISGIGQSEIGRRLGRHELDLTLDGCLAAIEDAGLTRDDIDGISTWPGPMQNSMGLAGPSTTEVMDALRINANWYLSGPEGPAQLGGVIHACFAVAMGIARHVLCYRTVTESTAQGSGSRQGIGSGMLDGGVPGPFQWLLPYHGYSAANWLAMYAQRHFYEYGTTKEQLGAIPINQRRNAALNPNAIYQDPMSMEDYLNVRMITTPLGLYDCDVPVDGCTAVIVSHVDYAKDAPKPVAHVNAVGTAIHGRPSWDQWGDLTTMAARDAGAHMWTRTDLRPSDVDVAELYDGFSFLTLTWLEALGFCGKGEGGPFIEGGSRIALDGELPLNTHGGQLSAGRLHGFGFVHEAVVQLRGEGGERQVQGNPQVAAVANGGGPLAGCMLLTRGT